VFDRRTAQEKHQEHALREFQDAVRQATQASELLMRVTATAEETSENLQAAKLKLRRVAEGSI
jgi:hypothetical protein